MKTNQVMIRPMGCFKVEQRTKDAMFNATALLRQWNECAESSYGKSHMMAKKNMADYFRQSSVAEFVKTIMEREELSAEKFVYVKSKANKGKNAGTWMCPILFVKFAMWLNPRFEVQVIKFVYDQMIAFRNESGDAYRELAKAVNKIVGDKFMPAAMCQIAKGLNHIVFGAYNTLIRNQYGSEDKMRKLFSFERKVADLINDGFLKSFDETMSYLRMKWQQKYTPKTLCG